jgi:hypothetical protein
MPDNFTDRLERYCAAAGIEIPVGFNRRSARRYAVIDLSATPPKLIATTWFKQEDLLHCLRTYATNRAVRILDLKARQELIIENGAITAHGAAF